MYSTKRPIERQTLVFIRPSLRRDVLWYTNVRLSVRPFHMSRSILRTAVIQLALVTFVKIKMAPSINAIGVRIH